MYTLNIIRQTKSLGIHLLYYNHEVMVCNILKEDILFLLFIYLLVYNEYIMKKKVYTLILFVIYL